MSLTFLILELLKNWPFIQLEKKLSQVEVGFSCEGFG